MRRVHVHVFGSTLKVIIEIKASKSYEITSLYRNRGCNKTVSICKLRLHSLIRRMTCYDEAAGKRIVDTPRTAWQYNLLILLIYPKEATDPTGVAKL